MNKNERNVRAIAYALLLALLVFLGAQGLVEAVEADDGTTLVSIQNEERDVSKDERPTAGIATAPPETPPSETPEPTPVPWLPTPPPGPSPSIDLDCRILYDHSVHCFSHVYVPPAWANETLVQAIIFPHMLGYAEVACWNGFCLEMWSGPGLDFGAFLPSVYVLTYVLTEYQDYVGERACEAYWQPWAVALPILSR